MNTHHALGWLRRAALVGAGWLSCWAALALAQPVEPAVGAVLLQQATRLTPEGMTSAVVLPDYLEAPLGARAVEATYRAVFESRAGLAGWAVYLSGAQGHMRLRLNGRTLVDRLADPQAVQTPRGIELLRLMDLPPDWLRDGANDVEITLRGRKEVSLSRIAIGPQDALRRAHDRKAIWFVYGPALVAAVMICLGLSVLLIWLRRPMESMYAWFGVAALIWGLHTAWSVSPRTFVGPRHFSVWWDTVYYLLVVVITVFCVRFAGYRMQRGARWLLASVLLVPLSLYATQGQAIHGPMHEWIRLVMVGIACVGLGAVARKVWLRRSVDHTLLLLAAVVATGLGLRDWLVFRYSDDNLPVQLTPYAGLPFVVLVAWILIDRFVRAAESLEVLNRDLEDRVRHKSTELVQALEHMRSARDLAEKADRGKTGFLAAASHDLRQPIHALGLYMGALRHRALEAPAREIVDRMGSSVAALDSLLDALLDMSRIDAGALVPQPRAFDVAALVHRLADEFAPEAEERGLRLSARVGGSPPAAAWSDPILVERVLRNLIGNAVKYTEGGGVLVTCRPRGRGRGAVWRVEVWDTGPGIAPDEQERVFDEFYQAGNAQRDRLGGLGLGLAIVRRLALLLELPLTLHSRPGRGTRFALDLPATRAPIQMAPPAEPELPLLHGMAVAVIEDDVEVRGAMRTLLTDWGCRVFDAADADDVVRQARDAGCTPAAVVADLRLRAGRDGLSEVARLRVVWGSDLPALIVSGDSAPERVRLMQVSGLPWLAKPVAAARLRSWLLAVVRRPTLTPPAALAAAPQESG
jgi:signal transduction histidine kinase/CheY-like chemotaxis protein